MLISVRLDDEVVASLDALGGQRSELIREAIGLLLDRSGQVGVARTVAGKSRNSGPERPERQNAAQIIPENIPKRVVTREPRRRDWAARGPEVLAVLGEHRYSVASLAKRLDWTELMLERVLKAMEVDGLIRFDRGCVVAA